MSYTTLMVSIIMYGLRQILVIFCCLQVNKIVYKKLISSCTTCHGFQSSCKVSPLYLVWFLRYACLNNNKQKKKKKKTNIEN